MLINSDNNFVRYNFNGLTKFVSLYLGSVLNIFFAPNANTTSTFEIILIVGL